MRHRRPPSPFLLTLILAASWPASGSVAQTVSSPYRFVESRHEASFFAGVVDADRGTLRLGPGAGPVTGVRYAFEITGPVGVEVSASYLLTDREVYDARNENQAPAFLATVDQHVVLFEGRFRLNLTGARTWYTLAPYLLGGGGLATGATQRLSVEGDFGPGQQFTFGPSATASLGAGTRWIPADRFGLRLEGTFNLWKLGHPPIFRAREEFIGPVSDGEWPRWMSVVLGASYRF